MTQSYAKEKKRKLPPNIMLHAMQVASKLYRSHALAKPSKYTKKNILGGIPMVFSPIALGTQRVRERFH